MLINDSAVLGVGVGVVAVTGERVIFGLPKDEARRIQAAIAQGELPTIEVDPSRVLHTEAE